MSRDESIARSISDAAASVEMEGYTVDAECREWCRKVLTHEITAEEYLTLLMNKAGVVPQ